jgi:hypothetical protein
MANPFCFLNIHCIFSAKERAPMVNPELRERLWPFLGGIAKQNGITPRWIGGGCRPRSSAAVLVNHSSQRQSHSINKGWIAGICYAWFSRDHPENPRTLA